MSFPAYPSYRDSGVEWLGEVPAHWEVSPFKWQIERNDGGVWGDEPDGEHDTIVLRSTEQTVDGHWRIEDPEARKLSEFERASALLSEGDLLVTKSSGSALHIGKTTIVSKEISDLRYCYSNFMQRIRTKKCFMPKLAWYLMNNDITRVQFSLLSNSTTGLANLNGTMIGQFWVAVPPFDEQQSITTFLDSETARIDALIEEQQRLIELLKEKRQAVISHAVTKGLDATAPMKDSGVEWLGEVPAHWSTVRLAAVAEFFQGKAHEPYISDDGEHVCVTARFISTNGQSVRRCTENLSPTKKGDILMVMSDLPNGRALARSYLVESEISLAVNQRVCCIRINDGNPAFFTHQLNRNDQLLQFNDGVEQTHLKNGAFTRLILAFPTIQEQEAISHFLINETTRLDTLAGQVNTAITLLQERRSALISAAVTGKIDVRDTLQTTHQIECASYAHL